MKPAGRQEVPGQRRPLLARLGRKNVPSREQGEAQTLEAESLRTGWERQTGVQGDHISEWGFSCLLVSVSPILGDKPPTECMPSRDHPRRRSPGSGGSEGIPEAAL